MKKEMTWKDHVLSYAVLAALVSFLGVIPTVILLVALLYVGFCVKVISYLNQKYPSRRTKAKIRRQG